jgi:predicted transposase YbfD/YdcC
MVESVEISRVNIRDTLSLDLSVWMHHPDDMDFRPAMSCRDKILTIISQTSGETLASVDLDDDQMQALEASLTAELRVKFHVHGMHGRLDKIAPIIADGKAKKLATANWKTTQPVSFE